MKFAKCEFVKVCSPDTTVRCACHAIASLVWRAGKKNRARWGNEPGWGIEEKPKSNCAAGRAVYQPNCLARIRSLKASRYVKTATVLCAAQSHGRMFPANHPTGIWTAVTSLALLLFNAVVIVVSNFLPS